MEYFGNEYDHPINHNTELPLLNSERKAYEEKIKEQKKRADEIYGCVLRKVNGIIVLSDYLTTEQKERLLSIIWSEN